LFFRYFLKASSSRMASADKMMVKAKGPVWHQKQKRKGIIPKGLRGVDREATWCTSAATGWVYGHGAFSIVPHKVPIVGLFVWMRNSANEAKRMASEIISYQEQIETICMDSKADDAGLYYWLKIELGMQLLTKCRRGFDKTEARRQMKREMSKRRFQDIYKRRSVTVEPMQGLVKNIFDLDRCWMRGDDNNRWLFAAMGVAVQIAQWQAYKVKQSTWNIKTMVLGV
jgi:hypothetical protein